MLSTTSLNLYTICIFAVCSRRTVLPSNWWRKLQEKSVGIMRIIFGFSWRNYSGVITTKRIVVCNYARISQTYGNPSKTTILSNSWSISILSSSWSPDIRPLTQYSNFSSSPAPNVTIFLFSQQSHLHHFYVYQQCTIEIIWPTNDWEIHYADHIMVCFYCLLQR